MAIRLSGLNSGMDTESIIQELVKAAQLAPSWKNTQVSRYYVAMGEAKKAFEEN